MRRVDVRSPKAVDTREAIVGAALGLFRERGYDKATMRLIAERAGVSTGNAYYYFGSKEELMQAYYASLIAQFAANADSVLRTEKGLGKRLESTLDTWIDTISSSHAFAADLFRYAADPHSSMSPFSAESAPARQAAIEVFIRLVNESRSLVVSDQLRAALPELLWMFQLGVTLYWVHDTSPDQAKTRALVRGMTPVLVRLITLSRLPVLRSVVDDVLGLFEDMRPGSPEESK